MSKKIAEGIGALVLDVKSRRRGVHEDPRRTPGGSPSRWSSTGNASGVRTEALVTRDGRAARPRGRQRPRSRRESIETLKGQRARGTRGAVGGTGRAHAGAERRRSRIRPPRDARGPRRHWPRVPASRRSGGSSSTRAATPRVVDDYSRLPSAPDRDIVVRAARRGRHRDHARRAGRPRRGGARRRPRDASTTSIDPAVGFTVARAARARGEARGADLPDASSPRPRPRGGRRAARRPIDIGDDARRPTGRWCWTRRSTEDADDST